MTKPTNRLLLIWGCALAAVVGIAVGLSAFQAPVQNPVRTPFTATSITVMLDPNGVQTFSRVESESFRSDGSSVRIRNIVNSKPFGLRIVSNLSKQQRVVIDPATRSITTYKIRSSEIQQARNLACQGDDAGTLLGYNVVKTTKVFQSEPTRALNIEKLSAPALGCYPLYKKITELINGKVQGMNETKVTSVILGEIAENELEPPSGYTERSPSEVLKMSAQKEGRECPTCEIRTFPALDGVYQSRK